MKILVTGSNGFVGKNLIKTLEQNHNNTILNFDKSDSLDDLENYCMSCDFVFHLAGVNRPEKDLEFIEGNVDLTSLLIKFLQKSNNKSTIVFSSSIQALLDNPYGNSKRDAEELLIQHSEKNESKVRIFRLPNLFGKWCKPNYNSVVATFCYNISNDLPVTINKSDYLLTLTYIDDVVEDFISVITEDKDNQYINSSKIHSITLGELTNLIKSFKSSRDTLKLPDMCNELTKKLYSTYSSYIKTDNFSYDLLTHIDERGSFTEFFKGNGQLSVNVSKPGIIKGNHWHHTKIEKFLVVAGNGVVRFRQIDSKEIIEYFVNSNKLEVIDIPVGYTHNIENLGVNDMVTIMWANEEFNKKKPDTYYLEV